VDEGAAQDPGVLQVDQPLPEALLRQRTVGQLLDLLAYTEEGTRDHT